MVACFIEVGEEGGMTVREGEGGGEGELRMTTTKLRMADVDDVDGDADDDVDDHAGPIASVCKPILNAYLSSGWVC